jgi:hypothetical protein
MRPTGRGLTVLAFLSVCGILAVACNNSQKGATPTPDATSSPAATPTNAPTKPPTSANPNLPDISRNQSINESKLRDAEIAEILSHLPYNDEEHHITIVYDASSKTLAVAVTQASSIAEYRERKQLAEAKLTEFGSTNLCYLEVNWTGPLNIKSQLAQGDLTTSGCNPG